jgi:hypothetical protein
MGSTTLAAGLPVLDQAHSTENHVHPVLTRDTLRIDGQLSSI